MQQHRHLTAATPLPHHEPSWWLRTRLADLRTRGDTRQTLACRHIVSGTQEALTALWLPQVMTCRDCAAAFQLDDRAAQICDRCGKRHDDTQPLAWRDGGVLVLFGLCPPCHRREVPA